MEQHHRTVGELRPPPFEIAADGVVGVQSVDMQQVDRVVGNVGECGVERAAHQVGEARIARVVEAAEIGIDLPAVEPGMLVALPGIHREAAAIEPGSLHGLAKGRIGHAPVGAEFDDGAGPMHRDEPVRERDMGDPGALDLGAGRRPEQRIELTGP